MTCNHHIVSQGIGGFPGHEHVHPTGEQFCLHCKKTLAELIDARDVPMGVSQWAAHGRKNLYWYYFEKEVARMLLQRIREGKICVNCGAEKEVNLTELCRKCLEKI